MLRCTQTQLSVSTQLLHTVAVHAVIARDAVLERCCNVLLDVNVNHTGSAVTNVTTTAVTAAAVTVTAVTVAPAVEVVQLPLFLFLVCTPCL
jgi:hypothetical protein